MTYEQLKSLAADMSAMLYDRIPGHDTATAAFVLALLIKVLDHDLEADGDFVALVEQCIGDIQIVSRPPGAAIN